MAVAVAVPETEEEEPVDEVASGVAVCEVEAEVELEIVVGEVGSSEDAVSDELADPVVEWGWAASWSGIELGSFAVDAEEGDSSVGPGGGSRVGAGTSL